MTSSYVLVNLTNEEYINLVDINDAKNQQPHTLFTANLPLMWRTCNGAGVLTGGAKSWTLLGVDPRDEMFGVLKDKRKEMEEVVKTRITSGVVKKFCVLMSTEPNITKDAVEIMKATHPSDWLISMCVIIYRIKEEVVRERILGRQNNLPDDLRRLLSSGARKQAQR